MKAVLPVAAADYLDFFFNSNFSKGSLNNSSTHTSLAAVLVIHFNHMALELRLRVFDFALHLPPDVNPYIALAQHLTDINKVPRLPAWYIVLHICTIVSYVCMLLGAIRLLRSRILTNNFKFVSMSNLGLIEIDLVTTAGLCGGLYALVSIPDLIYWQLLLMGGSRPNAGEIVILGAKFSLLLHISWSFLWVCASTWAKSSYTKVWMYPTARHKGLHPLLRYFMNGCYLTCILMSYVVIAYFYGSLSVEYSALKSILGSVVNELYARAPEYHSPQYDHLDPLNVLLQADKATVHFGNMIHFYRIGSAFYLIVDLFICLNYFCIRAFSLQGGSSSYLVNQCRNMAVDRSVLIKHAEMIKVRKRLILFQAILVAGGTLVHTPILLVQLFFKAEKFYVDKNWFIITLIGLHLPSSIWGNALFIYLNLNLDLHASRNNRRQSSNTGKRLTTFNFYRKNNLNPSEGKTNPESPENDH